MSKFKFAIIIWLLLLIGGGSAKYVIQSSQKHAPPNWKAARGMAVNHQITVVDLERPDNFAQDPALAPLESLVGRYLINEKNTGDSIGPKDLSSLPRLAPVQTNCRVFLYSLSQEELSITSLVDVGSKIDLCIAGPFTDDTSELPTLLGHNNNCFQQPLEILAIHRETSEVPGDWLLLKVPLAESNKLAKVIATKKRLLFITVEGR